MRKRQEAAKLPPGYYGEWAIWRDAQDEQVRAKLDEGIPYVVRFRSPGTPGRRVEFNEEIRGHLSAEDNYNDVVILKSARNGLRLPTLRFEHVNAPAKRLALKLMAPAVKTFAKLFPKQGNQFGFAITRTGRLRDWLEEKDGKLRLSPDKAEQRGQRYG